jgi:uncharacterized protein (TIGR03663 family)
LVKFLVITFCWITVIGTGAYLRFDKLAERPFHADEATGARIAALRMESGNYRFDPLHYHGPTLSSFAMSFCKLRGESRWQEMSKVTPRVITGIAGTLVLLVPLFLRRRFGDGPMLLAGAVLATSPLLVYFSRMFIHESLLVLFGMLALVSLTRAPRWGIPGLFIGLMFATKETFVISMIAWSAAGVGIAVESRKLLDRARWISIWQEYRMPVAWSLLTAGLVSVFFYTDGFKHPAGAIDAVRTFFVYKTGDGHEKPFGYYFELLALPSKAGGVWWFGTPVVLLAVLGFWNSFRSQTRGRWVIRFIAYAAIGHFLIYSLIAYKTPWLACLPWAHVCLLAGYGLADFSTQRRWLKISLTAVIAVCLVSQIRQTSLVRGRFSSNERNPFAYVPTRNDIETLEPWLKQLQQLSPSGGLEPIGVIGSEYWPLPWYLRSFGKIGYWPAPPADLTPLPLVFAMPEVEESVAAALQQTHMALPRGLRAGVAVTLFVRRDIWERWQNEKP